MPKQWSRSEVIAEIQSRYAKGLPMKCVWRDDRRFYYEARKFFGGWHDALIAAGIEPTRYRRRSARCVVTAIRNRHERGLPLSETWRDDVYLFGAAARRFGNWGNALRAAGFEPRIRRKWSKERVLAELQAWHRNSTEDLRTADPQLANAAARLFGDLNSALDAAGVHSKNRRWNNVRIIETIQDYYIKGRPIKIDGFGDPTLARIAKRRFGSWASALAAAGLSRKYVERRAPRTWTREMVIDALRALHADDQPVSNVARRDQGLYIAANRFFGGLEEAALAAGMKPARRKWTNGRVIREIRSRHARGEALTTALVFREDAALAGGATRKFGSWRAAVSAAGLGVLRRAKRMQRKSA